MPGFAKSPNELVERFHAITADVPSAEQHPTFSYPALFVEGNLVGGLYESTWFLRLGEADRVELLAVADSGPVETMPGWATAGYVALPQAMVAGD